jgi:hypothetical protein
MDSKMSCAITGIITFSSKFPFAPAQVIVTSLPITCAHTIMSDSAITGFTFPGMMSCPVAWRAVEFRRCRTAARC